jgi:hypothetical protein
MQQKRLACLVWKEEQGKGHIDVFFVIRDSAIRGSASAEPINIAVITLDEDPASTSCRTFRAGRRATCRRRSRRSDVRSRTSKAVISIPEWQGDSNG